eukprot:TRINITY_DN12490_c0_g1_i10.p1 TRINITY_DN12490_c0_g1~~TRINITY_DN12490_c0_g1_i10.p1  ORF type:complete len:304 (-),score=44.86 TRINITY_DN12490_c0_g1_i10:24-935(-)
MFGLHGCSHPPQHLLHQQIATLSFDHPHRWSSDHNSDDVECGIRHFSNCDGFFQVRKDSTTHQINQINEIKNDSELIIIHSRSFSIDLSNSSSNPSQSLPIPSNPFQSLPIPSNPFQSLPIPSYPFSIQPNLMLGGSGDQQPEVVRRNPFTGLPRLSKGIAGTMVVLYLLTSMSATLKMALTLIPGYTLGMFFVWNVFTCGFVETSLFSLLLSCAAVLIFGKQFEPLWGSKEFAKFILVVNTLVGTSLFVLAIVVYIFTRIEMIIFTPLFGFTGVIGAFTVALKQLMPEQEMPFCIVMQMRAK